MKMGSSADRIDGESSELVDMRRRSSDGFEEELESEEEEEKLRFPWILLEIEFRWSSAMSMSMRQKGRPPEIGWTLLVWLIIGL